jgi:hypothetical protein
MRLLIAYAVGFLPFAFLLFAMWLAARRRKESDKNPLTQRLLRPPGESLRVKIDSLTDKMSEQIITAMGCCGIVGFGAWAAFENPIGGGIMLLIGLAVFIPISCSLWNTSATYRDYRLGFIGERAVGEELNQLLASGWKVFHDVEFHENPGQKPFNIDHVVVGTGGVFAIETKTRRKRIKRKADDPKNEVVFNGSTLVYPWGQEPFGIDQARQRAVYLQKWLRSQLKNEVSVQPVLALPGWSVNRRAKSDLHVISGREIANLFRDEHKKPRIDPQIVNAIAALLEQKCRDVE